MTTKQYEVSIGTGDNDSDSRVEVALINETGTVSNKQHLDSSGRNNYEKGSIEIFNPVDFTMTGEPKKVRVYFSGNKWRIGGIWLTDNTSGKTWYALPNLMIGSDAATSPQDIVLQTTGGASGDSYGAFRVKITTSSQTNAGTDDQVFLKLFDGSGNSIPTYKPGDNIKNNWEKGSTEVSTAHATLVHLGQITHILLSKYGGDKWIPSSVEVLGLGPDLDPATNAIPSYFTITHEFTEDDNKWEFVPAN